MARKYKPISKWKVAPSHPYNLVKVDCSIRHLIGNYNKLLAIWDSAQARLIYAKAAFALAQDGPSSSAKKLQVSFELEKLYYQPWS